jgi:hypothetical protein
LSDDFTRLWAGNACLRTLTTDALATMHARIRCTLALLAGVPVLGCDGTEPLVPPDSTGVELEWTLLGLESDWVVDIELTPWGTFISTLDRGIFLLDGDGYWSALGPELWHDHLIADALLYVPADPRRLLAGVRYRHGSKEDTTIAAVFASYDRGQSWVPSDGGFAAEAPNPYRVYAGDLEVDPGDPRRVFMSTDCCMLRSLDAGETWELVGGDLDAMPGYQPDILIDPSRSGRIWFTYTGVFGVPSVGASHDWGDTWGKGSLLKCGGVIAEFFAYALALDPNRSGRLWVGVDGGVMWADDGGEAEGDWQCDFFAAPKGAVVAFAELDRTLYAATVFVDIRFNGDGSVTELTDLGLYRTADGATWDSLPVPPGALGATVAVTDSANGRLLMGTRGGLWAVRQ